MKDTRTHIKTNTGLGRRALLATAGVLLVTAHLPASAGSIPVEVWKDPDCGCCKDWVTHLQANGFKVKVNDSGREAMSRKLGIQPKYGSCHTALIAGYAIEGHVPAREIKRLLKDKPAAIGLAAPGMPVGAPGMDGPVYGGRQDAYDVLLLAKDGGARVYQRYEGRKA